jgi:AraC-like DNA-binding protein
MLRTFSPQARPDLVCFEYGVPTYHREYTRMFELSARFEQPFTGVVFDRTLMDLESLHKDEDVHSALRMIADRRIVRLTQHVPFAVRVREHLEKQGTTQRTSMKLVARSLGLSTRSLRRRLVAEGKSYNAVVNEALATVAKQCLRERQLTIQETAYEMGFADTSTFYRAFKRWTGMTPSVFREK